MAEVDTPIRVQSAVRIPTPEPVQAPRPALPPKRKRSFSSRSPSPRRKPAPKDGYRTRSPRTRSPPRDDSRSPSPPARRLPPRDGHRSRSRSKSHPLRGATVNDVDRRRAAERERQLNDRIRAKPAQAEEGLLTEEQKQQKAKEEYQRLLNARSGGTYIPPARLRALQAQVTDKTSKEYQRMAWEALKKSINGLINKVNVSNIKNLVFEIFSENLVRGRGLFCRSIMKAQSASLPFTPIYASLVAIVNSKLPQVGALLVNRLVVQFRKAFRRNDKAACLASTTFIAHLANQQVVHEFLAAQILQLLLSNPTDDSVEIAVGLMREVGHHLEEMNGAIALVVFDQFRKILHEADIDKRTQYMIEVLFQVRKDRYKDNHAISDELDLVPEEDQITHEAPDLEDELDVEDGLNIFKFDPNYEEEEAAYNATKDEILNGGSDDEEEGDSDDSSEAGETAQDKQMEIQDQSNADLTNLRRTIYLTINSSADFEECCHKLMKINLPIGKESELPSMIIETCSQRPTYEKFYGLVGERFARINRLWTDQFEQQFVKYYETIHRYETARLRNIARFFGHILGTEAIGWHVLSVVHLNEDETTSSSRIFIKILFLDLLEEMGKTKLTEKLRDPLVRPSLDGLFPTDNSRNMRFSINYFTAIGLGGITEDTREALQNLPRPVIPALPAPAPAKPESESDSASSYSSYSSYTGSSRSRSRSYSRSRSPPRKSTRDGPRGRSYTRSPSRTPPPRAGGPVPASARRVPPPRSRSPSSRSASSGPRGRERGRGSGSGRGRGSKRSPSSYDSRSISRSRSRSISQHRRRRNSSSHSRSASTSSRNSGSRRDRTVSRTPPRAARRISQTPPRRINGRLRSLSRSPPPRRAIDSGRGNARPSPPRRSNGRPRSTSRSRSPPRRADQRRPVSRSVTPPSRLPEVARGRHNTSSRSASPARYRSPPRRRESLSHSARGPGPLAAPAKRELSPYSQRVALTRGLR